MASDDTPDTELLSRIRNGDRDAFLSFANRYAPIVFRVLRPHIGDHMRAAWITELSVAQFLVRLKHIDNASVETLFDSVASLIRSGLSDSPGTGLSSKQLKILESLTSLPLQTRIIIEMVHFEGVSPDIVTRRLGVSRGEVATALSSMMTDETVVPRRSTNEPHRTRSAGKPPGKRPGSETRRYYHDSNRDRRRKH